MLTKVAGPTPLVARLLARYGRLYSEALGLDLRGGEAPVLFQWLCAAFLLGGRIRASVAERAAAALLRQGWTTADRMAASTWEQRVRVLNRSGYARYDESTSRRLGELAARLLDRYGGDLNALRAAARRVPEEERRLLKEFNGIGDVRADIFLREVQLAWDELYPFADQRAVRAAIALGLGDDVRDLARLVPAADFARLVAALVRCDLARGAPALRAEVADRR